MRRQEGKAMTQEPSRPAGNAVDAGGHHWPDLAGRLIEVDGCKAHVLPIRVYFEDTDFSGLVYHASYVRWCERGRSDFLRLLGSEHRTLIEGAPGEASAFVVRRLHLEYLRPARIDDVLEVTTRVKELTAATLVLDQRVSRGSEVLCTAEVTVVLVTQGGRVLRLSTALRSQLSGGA
jgi:acyl-CoA thioester hydrolase